MDCGIPFCHNGCPVNNLIPDWNDLVYRDQWQRGAREPALDQQLPGVHRPHLPGALRGVLHAEHRRQPGDHQDDRMRDRRPRLGGRLDRAADRRRAAPASASPSSAPARPAWPAPSSSPAPAMPSTRVREDRPHRRPAPLRHPRLQDGEAPDRPPHARRWRPRASIFRTGIEVGVDVSVERCSTTTTRWCWPAAPSGRATCEVPGRELDGIHFAMDFLTQQNKRDAGDDEARGRAQRHDHAPRASMSS